MFELPCEPVPHFLMSKPSQKHKKGRTSSSPMHAHMEVPRRCTELRPAPPRSECLAVLERPERKRNRQPNRKKCNQAPAKLAKPYNELIAYILVAVAITFSLHVSSMVNQNHRPATATPTTAVAMPLPAQLSASGEWQMESVADQEFLYGVSFIKHENSVIYGEGQDPPGTYTLEGKLWSNRVWFVKRYTEDARANGAPKQDVVFDGVISNKPGGSLIMEGKFETQVKSGFPTSYYKKTQWQTVSGRWSARRIGALPVNRNLQIPSQQDSWNPLRNLDAQPTSQVQQPVMFQEAEQKQNQVVATGFYCFLAAAVLAIFGWINYLVYRFLMRLSETPNPAEEEETS